MQLSSLIGKKTYQKQGFLEDGTRIPLTAIAVGGNVVMQVKTLDKEGYGALQLGIEAKKKANSAILGHVKKAFDQAPQQTPEEKAIKKETKKITPKYFKEVRVEDTAGFDLGTEINVSEVFAEGDIINVTGVSKGKGWAGGVKRYNFRGGPRTHGQSDRERAPGSIGQTTTPGRVYKGKKMAGRMGSDTVTVKNLEIIEVTSDGVILVKGLVPGRVNSLLMIKKVGENKKFIPLYKEVKDEPVVEEDAQAEQATEANSEPVAAAPATEVIEEKVEAKTEDVSNEPVLEESVVEVESESKDEVKPEDELKKEDSK